MQGTQQRTNLAISAIRTDGGTQPRAQIDMMVVLEYSQAMQEGAAFPPVTVFYDGSEYWLADGFHRLNAAMQLEQVTIEVDVRQGTRRDAVLYSVGANSQHGLRRINADKRRAVETLLRDEEWARWNNSEIARRCAVDEGTVRNYRAALSSEIPKIDTGRLVERNGTTYTMNATNIGHSPPTSLDFYKQRESVPAERVSLADIFDPVAHTIPTAYLPKQAQQSPSLTEREAELAGYRGYDKWQEAQKWEEKRRAEQLATHPILNTLTSKSNEWYTPQKYVDAARELMGGIDLDPASNAIANETVKAARYYDITTNGLDKDWAGRIWLNPPYGREEAGSNQDVWTRRLIDQFRKGITTEAVLLVNAAVDTKWFHNIFNQYPLSFPVCFPDHRVNFYTPEASVSGPTHGSALIYLGKQKRKFFVIFSQFGMIMRKVGFDDSDW